MLFVYSFLPRLFTIPRIVLNSPHQKALKCKDILVPRELKPTNLFQISLALRATSALGNYVDIFLSQYPFLFCTFDILLIISLPFLNMEK